MKRFTITFILFSTIFSTIVTAQDDWQTGSDLNYSINSLFPPRLSVVNNGGEDDTNGSNHYTGDIKVPETTEYNGYTFTVSTIARSGAGSGLFPPQVGAFQYSTIRSIQLPSTITSVQQGAFADNTYLMNIIVDEENEKYFDHDGVLYARNNDGTYTLVAVPGGRQNITILEGTTIIGASAFDGCTNIKNITLPSSITEINAYAFSDCALETLTCLSTEPPTITNSNAFNNCTIESIYVPAESTNDYNNSTWGNTYKKNNIEETDIKAIESEVEPENVVKYISESIIIEDTENYTRTTDHVIGSELSRSVTTEGNVTTTTITLSGGASYYRTFKNTNWQALYLPFPLKHADWSGRYEIAIIKGIYEDKGSKSFYVTATELGENDTVPAHTPCFIRSLVANADVPRVIEVTTGETLHECPTENTTISLTGPVSGNTYTFTGQYEKRNLKEADHTQPPYLYAMTGGVLKRPNPNSASGIPLGAFRWSLIVTPAAGKNTMYSTGYLNTEKNEAEEGNNTTSTEDIIIDLNEVEGADLYYDLNGRVVEHPTKGIYIFKGKKIYIE